MWIGSSDQSTEAKFIWNKREKSLLHIGYRRIQMTDGNEVSIEMLATAGKGKDRSCDYNNPFICETNLKLKYIHIGHTRDFNLWSCF